MSIKSWISAFFLIRLHPFNYLWLSRTLITPSSLCLGTTEIWQFTDSTCVGNLFKILNRSSEITGCSSRNYAYSPTEGNGISWGWERVLRDQKMKKKKIYMKLNWNFQRCRGSLIISLLWGRYGYFLEL